MKLHHALAALALAAPLAADVVAPGFVSVSVPFPTGATIRNLSNGSLVTCDGTRVQLWLPSGAFVATLGQFSGPGQPSDVGAMVVDPSETFVLVGNATTGVMLRVNLAGGQSQVAHLPGNRDAAFETPGHVIVSVGECGASCGTALVRLTLGTGAMAPLVAAEGPAGPVELDGAGNLYYGARSDGDLLRFGAGAIASPPAPAFQANDGLVVIEVESAPPAGDWVVETTFPGYTGESYYRWTGPDLFGSPGVGVLSYEFEIVDPGSYTFRYHNRHEDPAPDQDNDAWVKVDGGPWLKIFSNFGAASVAAWNWFSIVDEGGGVQYEAVYDLSAGRHTVQISGRSNGFAVDRMAFYRTFVPNPEDLGHPESVWASYNETDAGVVTTGLDGPREMVREPELDALLIADDGSASNVSRIRRVLPSGQSAVLVQGDPGLRLRNLDFTPQHGPGLFLPFQPLGHGALAYSRTGTGALNQHRVLATRRPQLSFGGPGAVTGIGPVAIQIEHGFPGGVAFFALAPAGAVLPAEGVVGLPGAPPLFVGLLPGLTSILPMPVPLDASGGATFTLGSGLGAPDVLGVQVIAADASGKIVGSSAAGIL